MASSAESTMAARNAEDAPGPANDPRSDIRSSPGARDNTDGTIRASRPTRAGSQGNLLLSVNCPGRHPSVPESGRPHERAHLRDHVPAVGLQLRLLVAVHQVEV